MFYFVRIGITWRILSSIHNLKFCYWCFRELEGGVFCGTIAKQLGVSLDNDVMSVFSLALPHLSCWRSYVFWLLILFCRPALDLLSGEGVIYEGLPKHYKICSDGWHLGGRGINIPRICSTLPKFLCITVILHMWTWGKAVDLARFWTTCRLFSVANVFFFMYPSWPLN